MFWLGLQYGLLLAFLIGPIFFALLQTGVEQGFRAGFGLGTGVWFGDIIYMVLVYSGLSLVQDVLDHPYFFLAAGMTGSALLIVFGLTSILTRPSMRMRPRKNPIRSSSYPHLLVKGFALNFFNPFTAFFWVGLITAMFVGQEYRPVEVLFFFSGMLVTVASTDLLKVLLARRIRRWLTPRHLLWIRRVSGLLLLVFGLALAVRVLAWG